MNGKGSSPRNCFSRQFKDNWDDINWDSNICQSCNGKGTRLVDKNDRKKEIRCGMCQGRGLINRETKTNM